MASFYDSASIITIPSGYKAGTLYSAKPTDGSGDMTFTRTGDTATRVNSAGLIERCITNLALQSNNFSTTWTASNVTIAGSIADPNGGTTAFSLAGSSATSNVKQLLQACFSSAGDVKTFSIYAKANTHSFIQIRLTVTSTIYVNFDLSTGTFTNGTNAVGSMTNLGGGWYRCQMTTASASTNTTGAISLVDSLSAVFGEASTTTNSVYIWRAQAQTGDQATNYIDTTTAAVTEGPVTNLPRLDYFGSTCPQLLMEPTRTNLNTYSQMIDNSAYVKDGVSVSGNVLVSPDGYTNADVMIEDTASSGHRFNKAVSWVSGTTYSASFFMKQGSGTRRIILLFPSSAYGTNLICNFNIQTGVITTSSGSITGKIENYGNGWYRCTAIATANVTTTSSLSLYLRQTDAAAVTAYTGDGTSSMYIWGLQVEAGAYATSYIPTTAATVTRNFDGNQRPGITSLIGQSEGTLFVDFNKISDIGGISEGPSISLHDGTSTRVLIQYSGLTGLIAQIRVAATIIYNATLTLTNQYRNKIAIAYKIGDLAVYVNGVKVASNALSQDFTTYNLTNFAFNAGSASINQFHARTNQALVFKTRLSDDELKTLTTL